MDKAVEILKQYLAQRDICLSKTQTKRFAKYIQLLRQWNKKMNLTAIESDRDLAIKHFYDSLTVLFGSRPLAADPVKLADVGSGAGFPGLPLKIYCEQWDVILVDSLNKRIRFLERVIDELQLPGARTFWGRAEEIGRDSQFREQFDMVTARAVAPLNVLVEYCLPLAVVGGKCVLMKGPDVEEELKDAQGAIEILGGNLAEIKRFTLPEINHRRCLLIIDKAKPTPSRYPRRPGMPQKRPLGQL